MRIFVTGLCTLHWSRLEYGNVGNYYIVEPLFREFHRVFPEAEIVTTFQMTQNFINRENIRVLPMNYYYAWDPSDLPNAIQEYGSAEYFHRYGYLLIHSGFIDTVLESDLIIDVSGDMWGDGAEHVGHNRFLIDLLKMRTAQLLGKKTILFASTPGPFSEEITHKLAKDVLSNFNLVTVREEISLDHLKNWEFPTSNVKFFPCPAYLFEAASKDEIDKILEEEQIYQSKDHPIIGFAIGGFNMQDPPYDKWPRGDEEYIPFAETIEYVINQIGAKVILISHTNGFDLPPNFKLKQGRDFAILNQLKAVVYARNRIMNTENLVTLSKPYEPKYLKGIIGTFDLFVTGRVHGSVASISQLVPTIFIRYAGDFNKNEKIRGFARVSEMEEYVCDPSDSKDMIAKISKCWKNREQIHSILQERVPDIKKKAKEAFDLSAKTVLL